MAWELLAGERPFDGASDLLTLDRVRSHDPGPLSAVVPEVSAALSDWVGRMLAKEPDARFSTAHEAARSLRTMLMAEQLMPGARDLSRWYEEVVATLPEGLQHRPVTRDKIRCKLAGAWPDAETVPGKAGGNKEAWNRSDLTDHGHTIRCGIDHSRPRISDLRRPELRNGPLQVPDPSPHDLIIRFRIEDAHAFEWGRLIEMPGRRPPQFLSKSPPGPDLEIPPFADPGRQQARAIDAQRVKYRRTGRQQMRQAGAGLAQTRLLAAQLRLLERALQNRRKAVEIALLLDHVIFEAQPQGGGDDILAALAGDQHDRRR